MARKFSYKGHSIEELQNMPFEQFMLLVNSKARRSLRRMGYKIKKLLLKIKNAKPNKIIKTQVREMVVVPQMVGRRFQVYNGKEYMEVLIRPEMLGKRLGDFSHTIKLVKHSGPGIGATRGSKAVELK
ncbi:ribosomal protein S19 family protein [Candidatus Micrarchaeota archaeon]|nr:ribosomal protein S19 family protein [Candidatus Micrarchaeota archaeon]